MHNTNHPNWWHVNINNLCNDLSLLFFSKSFTFQMAIESRWLGWDKYQMFFFLSLNECIDDLQLENCVRRWRRWESHNREVYMEMGVLEWEKIREFVTPTQVGRASPLDANSGPLFLWLCDLWRCRTLENVESSPNYSIIINGYAIWMQLIQNCLFSIIHYLLIILMISPVLKTTFSLIAYEIL